MTKIKHAELHGTEVWGWDTERPIPTVGKNTIDFEGTAKDHAEFKRWQSSKQVLKFASHGEYKKIMYLKVDNIAPFIEVRPVIKHCKGENFSGGCILHKENNSCKKDCEVEWLVYFKPESKEESPVSVWISFLFRAREYAPNVPYEIIIRDLSNDFIIERVKK